MKKLQKIHIKTKEIKQSGPNRQLSITRKAFRDSSLVDLSFDWVKFLISVAHFLTS